MRRLQWTAGAILPALLITLAASALTVAVYSLTQARWTAGSGRYAIGLWLGALCGAALGASRFRGHFALIYSLALSLAAAGEAAGQVFLPALSQRGNPFSEIVWGWHVRLGTLGDRAAAWLSAISTGDVIRDTGLFTGLALILLWQAGAWLAWALIRRRPALQAVLPLAAALGVNNHLSNRPAAEYAVFLACALALIAGGAYRARRDDWEARHVDYAESLGMDWAVSAAALVVVISMAAASAPLAGTPQGWRTLAELFRSARQQTAETAARWFADVNPPRADVPALSAVAPDLNRIGQPLPQGEAVVMWVTISDPPPPPPQSGAPEQIAPGHYWRSQVFAAYTGRGWERAPVSAEAEAGAGPTPGRYALTQSYVIEAAYGPEAFAVNAPVSATAGVQLRALASGPDTLAFGAASAYTVVSWATRVTGSQLAAASRDYPAAVRAAYLQLPDGLPGRVRDLARRLTADAASPLAKAQAVQAYLRVTYPYQLDAPAPPPGRDAVDYFLFDAPGGFCTYYASAMAVMLRAEGVPARVAAGFATGSYAFDRRAYRVPAEAAHAWVEVYFPGYGWVEFEPTPAQAAIDYGSEAAPETTTPPVTPESGWRFDGRALATGAALLTGALVLVIVIWRRRSRPESDPTARAYWRMRRALADAGMRAAPSVTPDEFLAACAPALARHPALRAAVSQATRLYVQAQYSAHPASAAEARQVDGLWARARGDRRRLWLEALWKRRRAPHRPSDNHS